VLCEALRELRLRGWGRCPGCLLEVATLEGETVLKGLHLTDEKLTLWRLKHVAMERSAPAKVTLCRLGWFSSAVSRSQPSKLTLWRLRQGARMRRQWFKDTLLRAGRRPSYPLDARSMRGLRSRGAAPASVRVAHPSRETRSRAVQAAREIAAAFVIREQWWKVTLWRVGQAHLWKSTLRGSRHSPSASATPSVTFERAEEGIGQAFHERSRPLGALIHGRGRTVESRTCNSKGGLTCMTSLAKRCTRLMFKMHSRGSWPRSKRVVSGVLRSPSSREVEDFPSAFCAGPPQCARAASPRLSPEGG
jgi:hypothetical protein